MKKRGELLNVVLIHIILIVLLLVMLIVASAGKINGRGVKQQVLEKQLALLIDAAEPGMSFSMDKVNVKDGMINKIEIKDGKVFVRVEGLSSSRGYPYFSRYDISVRDERISFVVEVK